MKYKLLFKVDQDRKLFLWINDTVMLPFDDLKEWRNFAEQMVGMIPEMVEHNGVKDD